MNWIHISIFSSNSSKLSKHTYIPTTNVPYTHTHTHMQHTLTYLNCSNGKFKFQIEILKSLSDEVVRRSFVWKLQIMSQATEKNLKSVAGDGRRPEICRMQRCIKNWQVNPLCNRFPVFCGGKKIDICARQAKLNERPPCSFVWKRFHREQTTYILVLLIILFHY